MNVANVWFPSVKIMITKQFEIHFSVLIRLPQESSGSVASGWLTGEPSKPEALRVVQHIQMESST